MFYYIEESSYPIFFQKDLFYIIRQFSSLYALKRYNLHEIQANIHHTSGTCSELPSYINTMVDICSYVLLQLIYLFYCVERLIVLLFIAHLYLTNMPMYFYPSITFSFFSYYHALIRILTRKKISLSTQETFTKEKFLKQFACYFKVPSTH